MVKKSCKISVKQSSSRDLSLDIMKGIGIILVVYGHTYLKSSFIYLFHMPLFFLLSGAAMNFTHHRYSISRRFKMIMVPYFVFSLLCFCYWAFLESRFRPIHEENLFIGTIGQLPIKIQQFLNIFLAENCINSFGYNVVLWFLPCLFVADFIYEGVRNMKFSWSIILLIVALYYLVFTDMPCMPWCFNIAILAVPFIWLGKIGYKKLIEFCGNHKFVCGTLSVILFAILYGMFKYFGVQINMFGNIIPPFYSFYSAAIIGSLAVAFLAIFISRISIRGGQIIAFLGRNSLVIMCLHEPIKRIVIVMSSKLSHLPTEILRSDLLLSGSCTLITILACIPFVLFINTNLFKWMIGK